MMRQIILPTFKIINHFLLMITPGAFDRILLNQLPNLDSICASIKKVTNADIFALRISKNDLPKLICAIMRITNNNSIHFSKPTYGFQDTAN